jgi:hypothetical protein
MAKAPERGPSPFQKLLEVRQARQTAGPLDVQLSGQETGEPVKLAKSADPDFVKFTVYVRRATHRAAKLRAVSEGRELSDIVEELLAGWTGTQPTS